MSAAAASPTPGPSACRSTAARIGSTLPDINPLTKLGAARGLEVYPAPPARRCASAGAMRAKASWRISSPRRCAPTAPSAMPRARAMCLRAGAAERSRRLAAGGRIRARPVRLRQGSDASLGGGFRPLGRTRHRRVLPAGLRRAARRSLPKVLAVQLSTPARPIDTRPQRRVEDREGHDRRAAPSSSPCRPTCLLSGGIQFTPELPHRPSTPSARLSLGSYDHIALELAGNPLGLDSDDLVFEKSADARTAALLANVSGHAAVSGRRRRRRSAASSPRTAKPPWSISPRDGWPALRRRDQEGDRAHPRHALERRAVDARRFSAAAPGGQRRAAS